MDHYCFFRIEISLIMAAGMDGTGESWRGKVVKTERMISFVSLKLGMKRITKIRMD